jgi:hypothetical protein
MHTIGDDAHKPMGTTLHGHCRETEQGQKGESGQLTSISKNRDWKEKALRQFILKIYISSKIQSPYPILIFQNSPSQMQIFHANANFHRSLETPTSRDAHSKNVKRLVCTTFNALSASLSQITQEILISLAPCEIISMLICSRIISYRNPHHSPGFGNGVGLT